MAIIDHTNQIFPVAQPRSFLHKRGQMAGLGLDDSTSIFGLSTADIQKLIAGYNSQQLFELNLQRANQGLPPLNAAQYAPQVAVGLNADTQQLLIYGGLAVLAYFLLKRA